MASSSARGGALISPTTVWHDTQVTARNLWWCAALAALTVVLGAPGATASDQPSTTRPVGPVTAVTATVAVPNSTVGVEGTLLFPAGKRAVRGIIVVMRWGLGSQVFDDPAWRDLARKLAVAMVRVAVSDSMKVPANRPASQQALRDARIGGAIGLSLLLRQLAEQTERKDLADAPVFLWGHSAAGSFALSFAALHPERTVGLVRYHSHRRDLKFDLTPASNVPALLLAGERDAVAGVDDTVQLFNEARGLHAPWTLAIEPGVSHGSLEELRRANTLMLPWVAAVFEQRVVTAGHRLRPADETWVVNNSTGAIGRRSSRRQASPESSWLPSREVGTHWRTVSGK